MNYRGSTGRGHDYSYAINADWGDKEVKDLLASVDAAVATGKIDADHMGVGGWSYGGILTDYTIASTTRFKAASSGAGMGDTLGFYGIDQYILQYENEFGPPWKNLDVYLKTSYPFLHADRIKTPTMFMGGDKDFNVPIQGGEQMYEALRSVGTPAELIVYPGQFHGFSRTQLHQGSLRALVRVVRPLCERDEHAGDTARCSARTAGEACSGCGHGFGSGEVVPCGGNVSRGARRTGCRLNPARRS